MSSSTRASGKKKKINRRHALTSFKNHVDAINITGFHSGYYQNLIVRRCQDIKQEVKKRKYRPKPYIIYAKNTVNIVKTWKIHL